LASQVFKAREVDISCRCIIANFTQFELIGFSAPCGQGFSCKL
jgi:hypothetical protein